MKAEFDDAQVAIVFTNETTTDLTPIVSGSFADVGDIPSDDLLLSELRINLPARKKTAVKLNFKQPGLLARLQEKGLRAVRLGLDIKLTDGERSHQRFLSVEVPKKGEA